MSQGEEPHPLRKGEFWDSDYYLKWPKVADAVIEACEKAAKFKVKRASWRRRNVWESNAFGYFGHTGNADAHGFEHASMLRTQRLPRRIACAPWKVVLA